MTTLGSIPSTPRTVTGPADLRDQKWLDGQVAVLGDGIEAARAIWTNWAEGRRVGRLHPDQSAGEYIASRGYRLTLAEAMAALPDGSTRQIAEVAGVDHSTVVRARGGASAPPDEPPARVIGADGKSYPGTVVKAIEVIEPTAAPGREYRALKAALDEVAHMKGIVEAATHVCTPAQHQRLRASARAARRVIDSIDLDIIRMEASTNDG